MSTFQPFEIVPGTTCPSLVILADHATNRLPPEYGTLGLPEAAFSRHIAYDIGVEGVARGLAERLGAPLVMSTWSRLLIDPNRGEDDPTLIMKLSDGAIIPANHPLAPEERVRRLDALHRPYHRAIAETIAKSTKVAGMPPLVISLHSFTPFWKAYARPWHASILWDSDPRAVAPFLAALRADAGLVVGDNEPYDGALRNDTMYRHCTSQGIAHALLEIRQDLIGEEAGISRWIARLEPILRALNEMPEMHEIRHFGSRTR